MALIKVLNNNWLQITDPYTIIQIPSIESISINSAGEKNYVMIRTMTGKEHTFVMDEGFIPEKFSGLLNKTFH